MSTEFADMAYIKLEFKRPPRRRSCSLLAAPGEIRRSPWRREEDAVYNTPTPTGSDPRRRGDPKQVDEAASHGFRQLPHR